MILPEGYSKEMPSEEGAYWMICSESNYEREPIEIRLEGGELIADDELIGTYPLKHYHNGLTDICWKKAMR